MPEPQNPAPPRLDSTLSKGLLILEALTRSEQPKGVTELSRELGLSKSNVFRLLQTLAHLGYVRRVEARLYKATLKTWQVGRAVVGRSNLREAAAPAMRMLAEESGETIYLAVPEGLQIVYIDKIESTQPIRSWNPVGGMAPIHTVSTGKAIVAAAYQTYRPQLTGNLAGYTDLTITSIKAMDKEVLTIARQGFAVDRGEFRARVFGYGAAILLEGQVTAAIGLSLPEVNIRDGDAERYGRLVSAAAADVQARLSCL